MKTKALNDVDLWDLCRGMSWPWSYCKTGTAAFNARGLQDWARQRGWKASLKSCRKVAAEINRYTRNELRAGVGVGESQLL